MVSTRYLPLRLALIVRPRNVTVAERSFGLPLARTCSVMTRRLWLTLGAGLGAGAGVTGPAMGTVDGGVIGSVGSGEIESDSVAELLPPASVTSRGAATLAVFVSVPAAE